MKPGTTYLVFDFWKKQFIGEARDKIKLTVQPGSVSLLAIHEKSGKPQFLSTDRHVLQGAVELEKVSWNQDTKTLAGISIGPLHTSHNVFVYLPGEHPWTWGGAARFRDYGSYSLKLVGSNMVRVHVRFDNTEKIHGKLGLKNFHLSQLI